MLVIQQYDHRRSVKDFSAGDTRLAVNSLDSQSGFAVTSNARSMFAAIGEAVESFPGNLRQLPGIRGYVWIDPEQYLAVPTPQD